MGRGSERRETSYRGFHKPLWLFKRKEKPSHLERPRKSHADLTEAVQTCPSLINTAPAARRPRGERRRAGRSRAEQSAAVSFTASFCFPLITEGLEIRSTMARYLLPAFPNKHRGAKQYQVICLNLCIFLKSVLCASWELCFWTFLFLHSLSHIPIIPIPHNIFPLP